MFGSFHGSILEVVSKLSGLSGLPIGPKVVPFWDDLIEF